MDRRDFMTRAGVVGAAVALTGRAAAQAQDAATRIPQTVEIHPSWLSWVTAVEGCLRALGVECDNVDVAGHSGYAFHMCISTVAGVEGPTTLPWSDLAVGARMLGRSTTEFEMGPSGEPPDWQGGEQECFALARREVDAGRPCVMWGTGIPEFGIIVGYEGDEVLYRWAGKPDESRVRCGALQDPGGPYLLMFPSTTSVAEVVRDRAALANALSFLHRRSDGAQYRYGLEAYDQWIAALQGKRATGFGNSYCAQCFNNAKEYCRDFVSRLAQRNAHAADPLGEALVAYEECALGMSRVAQSFPFPGPEKEDVQDEAAIQAACEALAAAHEAEARAAEALEQALAVTWPEP